MRSHLTRGRRSAPRRAFTLIELIVVIVVLGVLAALAIPTFAKMVGKTHDEAAVIELTALHRSAVALAALDARSVTYDDYEALLPPESSALGTSASGPAWALTYPGSAAPSSGVTVVDVFIDGGVVGLSMRSGSGRSAFVQAPATDTLVTKSWADECEPSGLVAHAGDPAACDEPMPPAQVTTLVSLTGNIDHADVASPQGVVVSATVADSTGESHDLTLRFTLVADETWSHTLQFQVYTTASGTWATAAEPRYIDNTEFGGTWEQADPSDSYMTFLADQWLDGYWDASSGEALLVDFSSVTYLPGTPTALVANP